MECVAAGETAQQALKTPNSAVFSWLHGFIQTKGLEM